jgi:hypothetical protein
MVKAELIKKIIRKPAIDTLLIALVIAMSLFLHWKISEIAVFSLFIWIILNPISSHYLASVAIFFLILTPIFLVSGKSIIADQLAIYAYYFLIMTVIMGIYEFKKDNEKSIDKI